MSHETHLRLMDASHDAGFVEVGLHIGSKNHRVYFRSDDLPLTGNIEALLAMALLPTMKEGGALVAEGKVSQRFLKALRTIQDIYFAWNPSLHRVEITNALPSLKDPSHEDRIGTFFSGGVDSFYTFLKHRHEITDLIFVLGFDVARINPSLLKRASETIHKIGSSFGKRVIEIDTNLYSFLDLYFRRSWPELTHGAGLATVGHLLYPFFKQIYIPSSHTYADLCPLGSHPILDPLWSTEGLEFVHDGCEANRLGKVAQISEFDIVLQNLRVCFSPNPDGNHNCGQCEKCLRTMINLHVAGALGRCSTFDVRLDIKNVSKLIIAGVSTRSFVEENLRALKNRQSDRKLYRALRKILNRPQWQARVIKKFRRIKGRLKRKCKVFP